MNIRCLLKTFQLAAHVSEMLNKSDIIKTLRQLLTFLMLYHSNNKKAEPPTHTYRIKTNKTIISWNDPLNITMSHRLFVPNTCKVVYLPLKRQENASEK